LDSKLIFFAPDGSNLFLSFIDYVVSFCIFSIDYLILYRVRAQRSRWE
jgi:hypothetical protein